MTFCVIPFDMVKACCVFERRLRPIQPSHPSMQSRKTASNVFQVDFEMLDIYRIKANDCRKQADVCFCDAGSEEVGFPRGHFAQVGFCS